jgi:ubiquinone/menaquinone biosynthesis C-methylase UbiE
MSPKTFEDPWAWMQSYDAERFGAEILDRHEQERWCRAVMLGGLPFMWAKAAVARELTFEQMRLRQGDRVLVIGECIAPCGFDHEIRRRIGPNGELVVVDITEEARNAYFAGRRGNGGQLATWRWTYADGFEPDSFDCVAVLQGVQHTEDWRVAAADLVRVLRPGGHIVLSEITFGPNMLNAIAADVHVEYVFEKISARLGFRIDDAPYYAPSHIRAAFEGLVEEAVNFEWRGVEMFWATKVSADEKS